MKIAYGKTYRTETVKRVSAAVDRVLDLPVFAAAELVVLNREQMRALNRETRGVDRPTDVLSFPFYQLAPGVALDKADFTGYESRRRAVILGSVAVCKEQCREQAVEYGHSEEREFAFLIVHGLLHILGYSHDGESDEQVMKSKAYQILEKAGF
ncbi:MAG: rRNA maturation RNase YbeY [Firmicutes bacterium]|nr:rRNA maturation RNase YbeY [Bacillota bacterium]